MPVLSDFENPELAMRRLRMCVYAVSLGGVAVTAAPGRAAQSLEDRQQAACYDDAQRLCPDAFPDVDKVKACMADKKKLVSPACAAFYPKTAQ
jgi:hypothetical protein